MRNLLEFCPDREILRFIRQIVEEDRRAVLIISKDPILGQKFFEALVEGSLNQGNTLGVIPEESPSFKDKLQRTHTRIFKTPGEFKQDQAQHVRSFLRQDPQSLLIENAEIQNQELILNALATGHTAGTVILYSNLSLSEFIQDCAEKNLSFFLEEMSDYLVLIHLESKYPGHSLESIWWGHFDFVEGQRKKKLIPLIQVKELNFDPKKEPMRFDRFLDDSYTISPLYKEIIEELDKDREKYFSRLKKHAQSLPTAPTQKVDLDYWPKDNDLSSSVLQNLKSNQRQAMELNHAVTDIALLSRFALQKSNSQDWPQLHGQPAELFLQIAVKDFSKELSFLPSESTIQIYFTLNLEASIDFENPNDPHFLVRFIPVSEPFQKLGLNHSFARQAKRLEISRAVQEYPELSLDDVASDTLPPQLSSEASKIGGWPHWIQADETPNCPHCQKHLRLVFQSASEVEIFELLGPDFYSYLFVCPDHHDAWAFVHQCS